MNRRKRKKQSPAIVTCRRRLACLGLICTFLLPQTVLAAEPAQQDNYTDATVLIEITDSVQQIEPADAAAQNNTKDSAEASESLQEDRKEEMDKGAPADDDAASVESKGATDSVPKAAGSDTNANAKANAAVSDDTASVKSKGATDSVPEAGGSDADANAKANADTNDTASANTNADANDTAASKANADANDTASPSANTDANADDIATTNDIVIANANDIANDGDIANDDAITNDTASDQAASLDEGITDDAITETAETPTFLQQSDGKSLTAASEFPSKFDLRDLGRVTPVKVQDPWGTCWAFAATAAAETSILSKMGSTYAETGLDLSERYLAWYVAQPVTEDISSSQAGEGLHLYDENPNAIYKFGGAGYCAGTLYAQGIGPVPESEYPYRGIEGKLSYETLVADKDAVIGAILQEYKQSYPYISEDELRPYAEQYYEAYLAMYETYDTYSEYDDWTISEADEPGAGRLRGTPYTLIDNNVFIYWITDTYDGVDKFDKEPIAGGPIGSGDKHLYQDSIDQLKSELYAGRGVSVCINLNDDALNKETWAYYFDGKATSDRHAVCIVGWDDDYPASNFTKEPPGNGAWIAKNSWGSQTDIIPGGLVAADGTTKDANGGDWGIVDENGLHTGYFYLSYYDAGINSPESFDFDLRENHDQENALQLDYMPAAASEWIHKDKNPVWSANVFTLDKDMRIDEVATRFATGFEVPLTGFTITFDIYRLRDGATAPEDGELLASCTREVSSSGYHRVALDNPVYSKAGDRLAVVVSHRHDYEDGSAKYFATSQISLSYRENPAWRRDPVYGTPVINEGESFLKIENVTDHDEYAAEGWLDLCAPFSRDFFIYMNPTVASSEDMLEWYASRYIGTPIKNSYHYDNFGIKAFGEVVTLEFVEAVAAACEKAGSLEYWRDPSTGAIFADESGTKPLTLEDVTVSPLGHLWGEPTYTWSEDNSSVTVQSICQRVNDHVLEETVKTIMTSNAAAGKITWTANFENEIFTTQTRSADTELKHDDPDEEIVNRQSKANDPDVRTSTAKKASAASAVIHSVSANTGDDADPALWYTMFAAALTCIAAVLALHHSRRRTVG